MQDEKAFVKKKALVFLMAVKIDIVVNGTTAVSVSVLFLSPCNIL